MTNPKHQGERMKRALKAKDKTKKLLGDFPGISGIGVGWDAKGHPILKVNIHQDAEEAVREVIPSSVDGIPVEVETVEDIFLE